MQISLFTIILSLFSCTTEDFIPLIPIQNSELIKIKENTIATRFLPPKGFYRLADSEADFTHYLRNIPLKDHQAKVFLFNGEEKNRQDVHAAVMDISVGKKDLQQCADAVMRLRAEYLWHHKKRDSISFTFTNGFRANYKTWHAGNTIKIAGNKAAWVTTQNNQTSYESFLQYMELVFSYCGTLSLSKELKSVSDLKDIKAGDVFIRGGSPGHAVIVVDVAQNASKQKVFMLAQSYMPAQNVHILNNFKNESNSPWYAVSDIEDYLYTPEYTFTKTELKRF